MGALWGWTPNWLGAILSANADTSAEYLRFKEKFDERKKEYDENKMKEALELIRRTNNLKKRYTMTAKENSYYFRVALKDEGVLGNRTAKFQPHRLPALSLQSNHSGLGNHCIGPCMP